MSLANLIHVLYDPAGWVDPGWLARYGVDVRWPKRLANRIVLRQACLPQIRRKDCDDARAAWLISHWRQLSALVYIAGARLARERLAERNALTSLRFSAFRFVSLPIPTLDHAPLVFRSRVRISGDIDVHDLVMRYGADCLGTAMWDMSGAWRANARMCLPPSCELPEAGEVACQHIALTPQGALKLLKFAAHFYHAKDH